MLHPLTLQDNRPRRGNTIDFLPADNPFDTIRLVEGKAWRMNDCDSKRP